jgi:hypothetical protein
MRSWRLWPLACCALLGACSFITNLDDLSSEGGVDATPDNMLLDVAVDVTDASVDVGKDVAHEAFPGCDAITPTPTICEDFDEPDAKTVTQLGQAYVNTGDTLMIDGVDYWSAPRSLYASVPLSTSQGLANLTMQIASSTPATAEAQLEILVDDQGTTASSIAFFQPNAPAITFVITPTGGWIQEGAFGMQYNNHAPVTIDWSSGWVKLDMKLVQSPPSETLTVNGKVLETQALDSRFTFSGPLQYVLGFTYVPPNAGPISERVDNVAFWITP